MSNLSLILENKSTDIITDSIKKVLLDNPKADITLKAFNLLKKSLNENSEDAIELIEDIVGTNFSAKTLFEYAQKSKQIDSVLNSLTREYCAKCETPCCHKDFYAYNFPEELQTLQLVEANETAKPRYNKDGCNYLTEKGCSLAYFKNPICLGSSCTKIETKMEDIDFFKGDEFNFYMGELSASLFITSPDKTLKVMDKIIKHGYELMNLKL